MNYRHSYHAGNFADVLKHVALVSTLLHLRKKDKPFAVIDTHAGRGLYDLGGAEAEKTGEAEFGIERLRGLATGNAALSTYLDIAKSFGADRYPGSPLIAERLLRTGDRLVAVEKHPEEFAALSAVLKGAKPVRADGYERLPALLPPPERRGLILIDPPYEAPDEFEQLARAFASAYRRFATGIYLLWYPLKARQDIDSLGGELRHAGATRLLALTLDVGKQTNAPDERLSSAGLFVVNPPFGFDVEMRGAMEEILPLLRQGPKASARVDWIEGEAQK
ncbi:MAG: 23S rRNA (adenine(2030)-N(6))-methyltransferase RlmJ [Proteobacteria bacterium]|nr:23S rRNA (adenine(2030)-N(6))-methyltransferase RlmJ [Pseudomonadota bacterium]